MLEIEKKNEVLQAWSYAVLVLILKKGDLTKWDDKSTMASLDIVEYVDPCKRVFRGNL